MKQPCVYILSSQRNGTLYVGVTNDLIKRVSTHVSESLKWDDKVKEAALAHRKAGKTEASYDRATHYLERVKLMQWYADEIDAAVKGADVIPISGKTAA